MPRQNEVAEEEPVVTGKYRRPFFGSIRDLATAHRRLFADEFVKTDHTRVISAGI